jgi:hypothetical protein
MMISPLNNRNFDRSPTILAFADRRRLTEQTSFSRLIVARDQ